MRRGTKPECEIEAQRIRVELEALRPAVNEYTRLRVRLRKVERGWIPDSRDPYRKRADRVVDAVRGGASSASEVARVVYGDEGRISAGRALAMLTVLVNQGRLRRLSPGRFGAVA